MSHDLTFEGIYQGRKWDAPLTDEFTLGVIEGNCDVCLEPIEPNDDATQTPFMRAHLECSLRSVLGDVQHLEGRCTCVSPVEIRFPADEYKTYRDSARQALTWLVDHGQGRFHP